MQETKPKATLSAPNTEKPAYETPIIVDLNNIQRGEGAVAPGCLPGSGASVTCDLGSGVPTI